MSQSANTSHSSATSVVNGAMASVSGDSPPGPCKTEKRVHSEQSERDTGDEGTSHTPVAKKKRGNLPKEAREILRNWIFSHSDHPFPTESEKLMLQEETNLTQIQINNWFINGRRRLLPGKNYQDKREYRQNRSSKNFEHTAKAEKKSAENWLEMPPLEQQVIPVRTVLLVPNGNNQGSVVYAIQTLAPVNQVTIPTMKPEQGNIAPTGLNVCDGASSTEQSKYLSSLINSTDGPLTPLDMLSMVASMKWEELLRSEAAEPKEAQMEPQGSSSRNCPL